MLWSANAAFKESTTKKFKTRIFSSDGLHNDVLNTT